jgi:hypothetical protein
MKKKTIIIIISILVLFVFGSLFIYYYIFETPKKVIAERCAGYDPNWETFINCYGVITITDSWDKDYISLKDHIHGYEIARIYNLKQFINNDEKIFVINRKTIEGSVSNGKKTQYYQELFQNSHLVTSNYDSILDIPTYLVIDYRSGEVEVYKNTESIPQKYKKYFLEIQNN